jgi:hypothetical protein
LTLDVARSPTQTKLSVEDIVQQILALDTGLVFDSNWGERAIFFNPGRVLKKGVYIATFKERDGQNDRASNLNRGGLFRFNLGLTKATYFPLFGFPPARPASGQTIDTGHDFTAVDTLMPHPVYGWMSWVAIINPSGSSFERLKPLLVDSLEAAKSKFAKRNH